MSRNRKRGLFDSSSDEEYPPKNRSGLPQWNDINLTQQTIQLKDVKLSLKKLNKVMTPQHIQQLYQTIRLIQNQKYAKDIPILDSIPSRALSAVEQYSGKLYRLKYVNFKTNLPFQQRIIKSPHVISHIIFPHLQTLKICDLSIENIQALAWIQAPNIRCLELYNNKITKLNTLNKANFKKLEIITFYHNPINQVENLYRIHSKKLTGYEFDQNQSYEERLQDYRFLFKMENPQLKMLKVQDPLRIDLRHKPASKILQQPGTKILYFQPRVVHRRQYFDFEDDYVLD